MARPPNPQIIPLDHQGGLVTREWLRYFEQMAADAADQGASPAAIAALQAAIAAMQAAITALQVALAATNADVNEVAGDLDELAAVVAALPEPMYALLDETGRVLLTENGLELFAE